MRDSDTKEDEFLLLPVRLRVGPRQLHSEDGEQLFGEQYQPAGLSDHQVDQAPRGEGQVLQKEKDKLAVSQDNSLARRAQDESR